MRSGTKLSSSRLRSRSQCEPTGAAVAGYSASAPLPLPPSPTSARNVSSVSSQSMALGAPSWEYAICYAQPCFIQTHVHLYMHVMVSLLCSQHRIHYMTCNWQAWNARFIKSTDIQNHACQEPHLPEPQYPKPPNPPCPACIHTYKNTHVYIYNIYIYIYGCIYVYIYVYVWKYTHI